jgi:hypothetical protein
LAQIWPQIVDKTRLSDQYGIDAAQWIAFSFVAVDDDENQDVIL